MGRTARAPKSEVTVESVIDLGTEFLVDISSVGDPYVRLAICACGQSLVAGSPWIAVNKQLAVLCGLLNAK
jgi:hypothetical protein